MKTQIKAGDWTNAAPGSDQGTSVPVEVGADESELHGDIDRLFKKMTVAGLQIGQVLTEQQADFRSGFIPIQKLHPGRTGSVLKSRLIT